MYRQTHNNIISRNSTTATFCTCNTVVEDNSLFLFSFANYGKSERRSHMQCTATILVLCTVVNTMRMQSHVLLLFELGNAAVGTRTILFSMHDDVVVDIAKHTFHIVYVLLATTRLLLLLLLLFCLCYWRMVSRTNSNSTK